MTMKHVKGAMRLGALLSVSLVGAGCTRGQAPETGEARASSSASTRREPGSSTRGAVRRGGSMGGLTADRPADPRSAGNGSSTGGSRMGGGALTGGSSHTGGGSMGGGTD